MSYQFDSWGVYCQEENEDIPPRVYGTESEVIDFVTSSPVQQMKLFRKWRKSKDDAAPPESAKHTSSSLLQQTQKSHASHEEDHQMLREVGKSAKESEPQVPRQPEPQPAGNIQVKEGEEYVEEVGREAAGSEEEEEEEEDEKESEGSSDSSDYGSEAEDIFMTDGLDDDIFAEKAVPEEKHEEHVKSNFEVLSKLPFFAQFTPEHREQLFSQLIVEKFQDGDLIVKQGTKGDRMYVIIDGEVSIWKQLDNGLTEDITYIYAPDFFGELALLYGDERVANVSAVGNTTVMYLTKESFDQFEEIRMFLYVSKVPFLKKLNKESQLQVVRLLTPVTFEKDQDVVVQGEIGDAFYMITKGSAQVIENEEPTVKLYDGHTFGQMALLSDSPRLATVRAKEHLTCLKLTAANFKTLLKDSGNSDFSKLLTQDDKQIRRRRSKREQQKLSASKLKQGRSRPQSQSIDGNFGSRHSISSSIVEEKSKVTKQTKHGKKVINGYVILEKIGSGTFGVVRKCRNEKSKTTYAIKIIDKKRFSGDELKSKYLPTLDDMRKEVAIMKKLSHPNVVNLVAVFDDPKSDALYILTEFCAKGAIMEDLVESQALPEATARKYFRDVLHGLEYLHYQQIVHRDIKPMNLLLTENDVVKIADFGAARMLMGDQKWVAGVAGTPAFMAPELLSENKDVYDGEPVDLWSCGATLYMFVNGSPPWMSDDELQLAKKVKNDELVFPKEDDIKLSPYVKNLIKGLLVKDPDKRMTLLETMKHDWVTDESSDPLEIFFADREVCASDQQLLPNLTAEEKTEAIIKVETSSSFMSSRGSSMRSALVRGNVSNPSVTGKSRQRASTFDIELGEDTVYVEHLNIDSDDDMSVRSECSSTYGLGEEDIGRIESFHRDKDDMLRVRVRKTALPSTKEVENEQTIDEEGGEETPPSPVGKPGRVSAKHGKRVSWCGLRYGLESDIGERSVLEDTTCIVHKLFAKQSKRGTKHAFYASLFDGHAGDMVSRFLAENVHKVLVEQESFGDDLRAALKATAFEIDRKFLKKAAGKVMEHNAKVSAGEVKQKLLRTKANTKVKSELEQYKSAGSTGLVALITKNKLAQSKKGLYLYLAWVGDSRAVLSKQGIAVQLTKDHRATRLDEKKRIRAAGGTVDRSGRLNGVLAVSRAFGGMTHKADNIAMLATMDVYAGNEDDFLAQGALTPLPDIHSMSLDQDTDEFIVMGSDGIFDVLTNQSVVDIVRKELLQHQDVQKAAKALVHHALKSAGSIDNTTAVIIAL